MRPAIAGVAGAVLVAVALLFSGCTTLSALDRTQVAGEGLRKAATPLLDAKCAEVAKTCPTGSKVETCKALMDCWTMRKRIYTASDAIQIAVAAGAAAEAAKVEGGAAAKVWLTRATAALAEAYRLAMSSGVLDEVMK